MLCVQMSPSPPPWRSRVKWFAATTWALGKSSDLQVGVLTLSFCWWPHCMLSNMIHVAVLGVSSFHFLLTHIDCHFCKHSSNGHHHYEVFQKTFSTVQVWLQIDIDYILFVCKQLQDKFFWFEAQKFFRLFDHITIVPTASKSTKGHNTVWWTLGVNSNQQRRPESQLSV